MSKKMVQDTPDVWSYLNGAPPSEVAEVIRDNYDVPPELVARLVEAVKSNASFWLYMTLKEATDQIRDLLEQADWLED